MTRLALRKALTAAGPVLLVAGALAACSYTSPSTTQLPYEPGDGTSAAVDDLLLRNVLVVAAEEGGEGALVGSLVNRSDEAVDVELAAEDGGFSETVTVEANQTLRLGEDEELVLPEVPEPPGAVLAMTARTPAGSAFLDVPVLDPSGPYETFLPTPRPTTGDGAQTPVTPSAPAGGTPSTSAEERTLGPGGGDG